LKIFKFYKIPTPSIINNLIGEKASIKLSSAYNLNDPFELKFNLDIDPLNDGHKEEYYQNNPCKTNEDFLNWQNHAINHDGYGWYAEQQQRNSIAQTISLCSFSEENKNNLMWSHYADNHKGICVEYTLELFEYLKKLKNHLVDSKIKYSHEPPTIKGIETLESKIQKIIFNKQSEWKYEKEYRAVFINEKETEYVPINKKFIKSVFIGSRTESKIEKEIVTLTENSNIDIFYAITLGKTYNISFEKRKIGTYISRAFWQ